MKISTIAECIGARTEGVDGEKEFYSLSTDSRACGEGALFICLKGEKYDGHAFAETAVKNGAIAVVTERALKVGVPQLCVPDTRRAWGLIAAAFYGNPARKMKIVGITGTNGKTTVAKMLATILRSAGKKTGIIGTLGTEYGGKVFPSSLTTPDPSELHKTFADMLSEGVEYAVMEVSAHALYYKKTEGIVFAACVFTNLTQDHLDFFGTMEAYQQAKSRLFEENACKIAVLNGDDGVGRVFGAQREGRSLPTLYYGMNTPTDAFAVITEERLQYASFMLNVNDALARVELSMTGRHNVYNALAAAACACALGVELSVAAEGLRRVVAPRGRLQHIGLYDGVDVYVDFAHTPDGLRKSLYALRKYCRGRLICLFGCGGNRDKGKRSVMGEVAAKTADFCILTSDNPRYEDPLDILSEIEKGYRRFSVRYVVVPDRKQAIEYGLDYAKRGDILLIAGKGGEDYQEIMGIKYPFDDQTVVEKLIRGKGKPTY